MNNYIAAKLLRTKHCPDPHLVITVDATPLDELIADATGNEQLLGLIPAWLNDLSDPAERKVVWDRVQSANNTNAKVPVLMCPDDLDLWCSIVIADASYSADTVTWHAFGVDVGSSEGLPNSIGTDVDWFDGVGPYHFSREDYDGCVAAFRRKLDATYL